MDGVCYRNNLVGLPVTSCHWHSKLHMIIWLIDQSHFDAHDAGFACDIQYAVPCISFAFNSLCVDVELFFSFKFLSAKH